jgi:NADPH:quinone reductase-like Zn-dependent oxidoreductase
VKAISANPVDYKVRKRAAPTDGGYKILGFDAAGVVDAVGPDVSLFKPGDEVFYAGSIQRQGTNSNFIWSTNASSATSPPRCRSRRRPPCP